MGIVEIDQDAGILRLIAHIYLYGDAADDSLSHAVATDINTHWNEMPVDIRIKNRSYTVRFELTGEYAPELSPNDIFENDNPLNNYFRVEEYAMGNISFVDGLGCNTGYFKLDNLINNSTTAAHEFGHTLGLEHPLRIDIRGKGQPGIMYPRGTLVDPEFQYDPHAEPGAVGGTLNPFFRKVLPTDITDLRLEKLRYNELGKSIIGNFSSIWHHKHVAE